MSTSSNIPLGAIRLQAQYRADLENNPFVSTQEWNSYISNSHKELYDLLVGAYGNNYAVAQTYQFQVGNSQLYPLPDGGPQFQNSVGSTAAKFYKLIGVDLQYSASPSGYVTLKRFEFIERNRYAYPNSAINFNAYTNLRYGIQGDNIMFMPTPMSGQTVRLWYIPAPTSLQYMLSCQTTLGSTSIQLPDTTGLSVGMSVAGLGVNDNSTVTAVASTSLTISAQAQASYSSSILSFWNDNATLDGISGWEDYVIVDAAIKASIKQEDDIQPLLMQRMELKQRIESMAEARDAGQAFHVSDALGMNSYGFFGSDSGNNGFGDY